MNDPSQTNGGNDTGKLSLQGLSTAAYVKAEAQLPPEHKAAFAMHLAAGLNAPGDNAADVAEAESILRVIIWNNEGSVLESIAKAAASNPNMPNSLAWALANDDEAVAAPVLQASLALSDAELTAIVESSESFAKMGAIARRASVSADLSRSLATHGDEDTAQILLNNANADIPEDALTCMLDRHEQSQKVVDGMAGRNALSFTLTERLLDRVSPELAGDLRARHAASTPAADPARPRIDRNIMGYRDEANAEETDALVSQLLEKNEITAELLVHKICNGYFEFFVAALAVTSTVARQDMRDLLLASPAKNLPDFWKAASLSADWLPVGTAALAAFIFVQKNYSKSDVPKFRQNIADRALTTLKNEKHTITHDQMRCLQPL